MDVDSRVFMNITFLSPALANQTNLALKGIIGLEAASMIANLTTRLEEASIYDTKSPD